MIVDKVDVSHTRPFKSELDPPVPTKPLRIIVRHFPSQQVEPIPGQIYIVRLCSHIQASQDAFDLVGIFGWNSTAVSSSMYVGDCSTPETENHAECVTLYLSGIRHTCGILSEQSAQGLRNS